MKTKILMLAAIAAIVSCSSGGTLEKEIGNSLAKSENIKGYEFVDQEVIKNVTIENCLNWEKKYAEASLKNIRKEEEWYGKRLTEARQNTKDFADGIEKLRQDNPEILSNNYGRIVKIKFKNREYGELVESSRYFVLDNDDRVLFGPYLKYDQARDEYKTMTLSHLKGYTELRAAFSPHPEPK